MRISKKTYQAIIFKQRPTSLLQVAFVATSDEIDSWARVPTKRTGNIRNFQRAQIDSHVKEVQRFFVDPNNCSPTAVVVGFDSIRSSGYVLTLDSKNNSISENDLLPGEPILGYIEISWNADSEPQNRAEYIQSILQKEELLRAIVVAELVEITGKDADLVTKLAGIIAERAKSGEILGNEDNDETIVFSEETGVDSEQNSDTEVLPMEVSAELAGLSPSERLVLVGRLGFLSQIQDDVLNALTDESLKLLYREVMDELKPGILIDGQHRIMGTKASNKVPFLVTALPGADWPELAFQFIVTNRTAKRVAESLLINIIGSSLSNNQRGSIENRLRNANIRVGLIEAVMKVHEDVQSPFYDMLAFGLKDETGFIDAAAMRGKVIQLWYERKSPIKDLFDHFCIGRKLSEKTEYWQEEELWYEMFISFWSAIKERYNGSEVFANKLDDNGNRIPSSKLMTATVLKIFQETILNYLYRYLLSKQSSEEVPIEKSIPNADGFQTLIKNTVRPLIPEFFVDWQLTGFDGSKGARDDLADAIQKMISGQASLSKLKKDHRLFKQEKGS